MSAKEKAVDLVEMFKIDNYDWIAQGSNVTAKKYALIAVENQYTALREQIFNMRVCRIIESERTYLHRLDRLLAREKEIKTEIEKL